MYNIVKTTLCCNNYNNYSTFRNNVKYFYVF
nr:MAG TPA: hypothetical protein [Bacteriophage sp.]